MCARRRERRENLHPNSTLNLNFNLNLNVHLNRHLHLQLNLNRHLNIFLLGICWQTTILLESCPHTYKRHVEMQSTDQSVESHSICVLFSFELQLASKGAIAIVCSFLLSSYGVPYQVSLYDLLSLSPPLHKILTPPSSYDVSSLSHTYFSAYTAIPETSASSMVHAPSTYIFVCTCVVVPPSFLQTVIGIRLFRFQLEVDPVRCQGVAMGTPTSADVVANLPRRRDGSVGPINDVKGRGFINAEIDHFVDIISAFVVLLRISFFIIGYAMGAHAIHSTVTNVPEGLLLIGLTLIAKQIMATNQEDVETIGCSFQNNFMNGLEPQPAPMFCCVCYCPPIMYANSN